MLAKSASLRRLITSVSRKLFSFNGLLLVSLFVFLPLLLRTLHSELPFLRKSASIRTTKECRVTPRFLTPTDYDRSTINASIPDHVLDFNKQSISLPKYLPSELYLVSVSSNNTYPRQIAQRYTFGRIFDILFVTDDDFPSCILCSKEDVDDDCHCPKFRKRCFSRHIFHDRSDGWWCATRKALAAIEIAMRRWTEDEYPAWLHLLDDNTWVNPISERLVIENLDPDELYFIGDDFGGFIAGGPGFLMSRGVVRLLMGAPVVEDVEYRWPNGTYSICVETQLQSCIARMQGGDWCFYHGDWALAACVYEVGVNLTAIGGRNHTAFFTQVSEPFSDLTWFEVDASIAPILHETHSSALHIEIDDMFEIFYRRIVPYYKSLHQAFKRGRDLAADKEG